MPASRVPPIEKEVVQIVVYARSDLCYVGISRDHGGCGEGHSRPVVNGAPARVWALTCHNGCEDFLRSDPLWASQPHAIPETPDETAVREDVEKRGQVEQAEATAHALTNLARLGELPQHLAESLAKIFAPLISGQQAAALPAGSAMTRLCRNGHGNRPDARFCSECGVPVDEPVPSDRGKELEAAVEAEPVAAPEREPAAEPEPEPDAEPAGPLDADALGSLPLADLKVIAERLGVRTTRSKADQITLILEHLEAGT